MKRLFASALVLGSLLSAGACATEPDDELATDDESDDDESKADSSAGVFTFFSARVDQRRCAAPFCGGFWVDRVNRKWTTCPGSSTEVAECYVADIDFSRAGLSENQISDFKAYIIGSTLLDKQYALMRGKIVTRSYGPDIGNLGVFEVSEAWLAHTQAPTDGIFVKLLDSGARCIAAPCESTRELKLNSSLSAAIAEVDYQPSGASADVVTKAGEALFSPDGVIIAGDRYRVSEDSRTARARTATNVYFRVGGASSPR